MTIPGVEGFMYPNEVELQWSLLIVLYPFITGLVAGAFILASLERVFNVEAVKPTYRLALLTALSFLLVAPLPLQLHLGHPERSFEMYLTPHRSSAMAMFGFVYLWYLMVVLLLEIWLDFRADIVHLAQTTTGLRRMIYTRADAGVDECQPGRAADRRQGGLRGHGNRHPVGILAPRIRRLHLRLHQGEPVVVHAADADRISLLGDGVGIAAVLLLYMVSMKMKRMTIDMRCMDTIAKYLFYTFVIDFTLEMLDLIHRTYESGRIFRSLDFMVHTRLWFSQVILQILMGTLVPLALLAANQLWTFSEAKRKDVRDGLQADHDRDFRHALERGDRRAAVLQELPGIYHL